jgi:hypothetical protein
MKVFISYAHVSDAHKAWVKNLADSLEAKSLDVILDQDDLRLGQLIQKFQSDGIESADRVLVICSAAYVAKCDTDPNSGAGQEKALMQIELSANQETIKFIPLLKDNPERKMPSCLKGRLWLDASNDTYFANTVERIVEELTRGVNHRSF